MKSAPRKKAAPVFMFGRRTFGDDGAEEREEEEA
jgi:hypothetical protein